MSEPSCPQLEQVREWLLGNLDETQSGPVENHAARCPDCREEVEAWRLVERVAHEFDRYPDPGPGFWRRFEDAVRQTCVGNQASTAPEGPTKPAQGLGWKQRLFRPRVLIPSAILAAAVAILLIAVLGQPARAIQETLNAMASVDRATCTGTYTAWRELDRDGNHIPESYNVILTYAAPGTCRVDYEPHHPSGNALPFSLVVEDGLVSRHLRDDWMFRNRPLDDPRRPLSPVDLFYPSGFIGRAVERGDAQVRHYQLQESARDTALRGIRVSYRTGQTRNVWEIEVGSDNLVQKARALHYDVDQNGEFLAAVVVIDSFDYGRASGQ